MMTSLTWAPSTPARSIAAMIAALPSSWAGRLANAPLNEPTGVRAALTMTISSLIRNSFWQAVARQGHLALPHPRQPGQTCQQRAFERYQLEMVVS